MSDFSRRDALKAGAAWALSPALIAWGQAAQKSAPKTEAKEAPKTTPKAPAKDPYADAVFVKGEPEKPGKGSFTIAVLPDTQHYSEKYPANFVAQTNWIVENRRDRNIAAVLHLGDITNNNKPAEWENAVKAMDLLNGKVPYAMVPGNHDYSAGGGCKDRTTLLNDYFPLQKIQSLGMLDAVYDKEPERLENSASLFSAGGLDFVVIGLEFGPRKDVVRWANEVATKHKNRAAILITHAYMYFDETRYDWKKYGTKQSWNPHGYAVAKATDDDVSDGEELWNNLISKHENFICTLNGHVLNDGLGRLTSKTPGGREIPQMLVNFQMKPKGGDGWLRLMEFDSTGKRVKIVDYSPTRNERNESVQNKFELEVASVRA